MDYCQRTLNALRSDNSLAAVISELEEIAHQTPDRALKIHLDEVLRALSSPVLAQLQARSIKLPLDTPPYRTLAAYCQRQASK